MGRFTENINRLNAGRPTKKTANEITGGYYIRMKRRWWWNIIAKEDLYIQSVGDHYALKRGTEGVVIWKWQYQALDFIHDLGATNLEIVEIETNKTQKPK